MENNNTKIHQISQPVIPIMEKFTTDSRCGVGPRVRHRVRHGEQPVPDLGEALLRHRRAVDPWCRSPAGSGTGAVLGPLRSIHSESRFTPGPAPYMSGAATCGGFFHEQQDGCGQRRGERRPGHRVRRRWHDVLWHIRCDRQAPGCRSPGVRSDMGPATPFISYSCSCCCGPGACVAWSGPTIREFSSHGR